MSEETSPKQPNRPGPRERYICSVCQGEYRHASSLAEHRSLHTGHTPFVCPFCGKTCRLKGNLKKHMRTHFTTREELEAAWAPYRVIRPTGVMQSDETAPSGSGRTWNSRSERNSEEPSTSEAPGPSQEMFREEEEEEEEDEVAEGGEIENNIRNLERAIRGCSNMQELYDNSKAIFFENHRCKICDQTFKFLEDYQNHQSVEHQIHETDEFRCQICHRSFHSELSYEQHDSYHQRVKCMLRSVMAEYSMPDFRGLVPKDFELELS